MSTGEKLTPKIKETLISHLEGRPEIIFAILYGSAAEGVPFRDLDVALWVDRALVPESAELDYAFDLADELERILPYPVDLRVINEAPLPFRYNVSRGTKLVVNDYELYYTFRERTWGEYFDFEPVMMQYLRDLR